uniref:peptidylprolyl isomerase n=1 Tax=Oryza rufipogon TaxID=4529 RepID=A0A0E0Q526_ORYRU
MELSLSARLALPLPPPPLPLLLRRRLPRRDHPAAMARLPPRRHRCRSAKIPESEFTTLPNGLKYYDITVGSGLKAVKGSRVAVHYVAKWKGITFMTSRQGLGVGGGTPYGFDIGNSERGNVLKGLDLGVEGMKVGGQRLIIVPPELAYGKKGVQEIPPNATIEEAPFNY